MAVEAGVAILQGELLPYGIEPATLAGIQLVTTMTSEYDAITLASAVARDAA